MFKQILILLMVFSVTACATRDDETEMPSAEKSVEPSNTPEVTSYDLPEYSDADGLAVMVESDGIIKSFWIERKSNAITYDDYISTGQEWIDRVYKRYIDWADKNLGKMKSSDCVQYLQGRYSSICSYMFYSNEVYEVVVFDRTGMNYEPPSFDSNDIKITTPMIVVHGYDSVPFSSLTAYDNNWWAWEWWTSQDLGVQSNLDDAQQELNNMIDSYNYEYIGNVTKDICFSPNKPNSNNLIFWSMVFKLCTSGLYEPRVVEEKYYNIDNIVVYGFVNQEYKNSPNF